MSQLDPTFYEWCEVKDSGVAVLEGSDATKMEEQPKNIAHTPLPILEYKPYSERFYWGATLLCRVCGRRSGSHYFARRPMQPWTSFLVLRAATGEGF